MTNDQSDLHELARLYGVEIQYDDIFGRRIASPPEAILWVAKALGAEAEGMGDVGHAVRARQARLSERVVDPVTVAWDTEPAAVSMQLHPDMANCLAICTIALENGETLRKKINLADLPPDGVSEFGEASRVIKRLPLPDSIPWGYHRATIMINGTEYTTRLICAPVETYQGDGDDSVQRTWGVFAPLYALHSERSWGSGDFTDLESLTAMVGDLGGGLVSTLPLLPTQLDHEVAPSPYSPTSRLLWNEFYLDVTRIPELESAPAARDLLNSEAIRAELDSLRAATICNYTRGMAVKRLVLAELASTFLKTPSKRRGQFRQFLHEHPRVEDYAAFRATCEREAAPWQAWPARLRDGELREGDYDDAVKDYHAYVQWLAYEQIASVAQRAQAMGVALYLDLPLGVHPDGYDVWRERSSFAIGASVGAPPDTFFSAGQSWGFPPPHPERSREHGYPYQIACIRHHLRHAGALRIDHVMGLHRLFWVPPSMQATDGVYVRQRAEEQYAILSLESHRNRALIVGEDLGTVPDAVRAAMRRHRVRRTYVAQYDLHPDPSAALGAVPGGAFAAANTHDMPTFSGFWDGIDIDDRQALGLADAEQVAEERRYRRTLTQALADSLHQQGLLTRGNDRLAVYRASLRYLAGSKASAVLVNLEDLWMERQPQNVPGTLDERPNWRRKTRYPLDVIRCMPDFTEPLTELSRMIGSDRIPERRESDLSVKTTQDVKTAGPVQHGQTSLTDDDVYLFNEGTHYNLYDKLGARVRTVDGVKGTSFAVWAPDAERVYVCGDFNHWHRTSHPLQPRGSSGIWEGFIPGVERGANYKYMIHSRYQAYSVEKADPLALHYEIPPRTASVVWDLDYTWGDRDWMEKRKDHNSLGAPQAIYEVHLGSWMRVPEENSRFLTYRELAPKLADYVRQLGFTHVEFLPVMEHPFYGSWGYQTTGYFAPTSRYGTPQDFMYLVDYLHRHDIGVILDWVPSHFPTDQHALAYFDGTHLFEHADRRKGHHPDWDSSIFNYGRNEVRSFLLSSALFWLDKYHADGLRVDAVASMLYLDYSRKQGEWIPNEYGGRENLEALAFLRQFNAEVYRRHPDVQTIAEESTDWPMVSRPTYVGGLGFGLKWDMGWMHDTLVYMSKEPIHRKFHHNELTFRMLYAFTENFALPLSHDEVVHGKGSLLGKMPGDDWQKFANLRTLFGYMYSQPGKKLLFMGGEFGQWNEWYHDTSLDWNLLEYEPHQGLQRWVTDLNRIYTSEPALYELDTEPGGFEWIDCSDSQQSVVSLIRKGRSAPAVIVAVANFTPVPREGYRIGVPFGGSWTELLNSDAHAYGGSDMGNGGAVDAEAIPHHGRPYSLNLTLPPLAIVFFRGIPA